MNIRLYWYATVVAGMLLAAAPQADSLEPPPGRTAVERLGPEVLDPSSHGIGKRIADMRLGRLFGGYASLHGSGGDQGTVIVVRDPECPVSRAYGPRQAKMARNYQARGFNFIVLYLNDTLQRTTLARDAGGFDGPAVFVKGGAEELAKALGVNSTGDVFVLDAGQHLRYRGAVDDQYGIGYTRDFPTRRLLRNALDALLDGRPVAIPATTAPGCHIETDPGSEQPFETWNPQESVS